jgi:hypothetical protein
MEQAGIASAAGGRGRSLAALRRHPDAGTVVEADAARQWRPTVLFLPAPLIRH